MKKIGIVCLFFVFLFMGMLIGSPTDELKNQKLEEDLKNFESEIVIPNNNYNGIKDEEVNPNIVSKFGKKIEEGIDKAFDIAKDVLKKLVD